MAPLASMASMLGYKVQGSDISSIRPNDPLSKCLIKGTQEINGWYPADTVVYSSAISANNPELSSARACAAEGTHVLHRSEFLQKILQPYKSLVVSGTHGKSTTSALLTHLLDDLGQDPLAVIGANMIRYHAAFRYGQGEFFIAEADESDGSFLNYDPYVGIVTDIDIDHLDHFGNIENIIRAFESFIDRISPEGFTALYWDNDNCREIFRKKQQSFITYGFSIGSEVRALDINSQGMLTEFTVVIARQQYKARVPLLGKHNILNCLGALSVIHGLKLNIEEAINSLSTFQGVQRRLNLIFQNEKIRIFDDYAHNPGKIAACIKSLKNAFPKDPLIVIFQPHRYSRLATMYVQMLEALQSADYVITVPVYSAGEAINPEYNPERIAYDLQKLWNIKAIPVQDMKFAHQAISKLNIRNFTLLTCGAGNIDNIGPQIADEYR